MKSDSDSTFTPLLRYNGDPVTLLSEAQLGHLEAKHIRDLLLEYLAQLNTTTIGVRELAKARLQIFEHQIEVLNRVLSNPMHRHILADEVGLGKTIEAGLVLRWLTRHNPHYRVLLVAPATMMAQWRLEMSAKLGLKFEPYWQEKSHNCQAANLVCVQYEELADTARWQILENHFAYDVLVMDEGHRLIRDTKLQARMIALSLRAKHCLVLSATPIGREAKEYHTLLKLAYPQQYVAISEERFMQILHMQEELKSITTRFRQDIEEGDYRPKRFEKDLETLKPIIHGDAYLMYCARAWHSQENSSVQQRITENIVYYLERIYRLEALMTRKRRASLSGDFFGIRKLDAVSYTPSREERDTLEAIHYFMRRYLKEHPSQTAYAQLLFSATASSPEALIAILRARQNFLEKGFCTFIKPNIRDILIKLPKSEDEKELLSNLLLHAENWRKIHREAGIASRINRVISRLRTIRAESTHKKVIIFCYFPETLTFLQGELKRVFTDEPYAIAQFNRHVAVQEKLEAELQKAAQRFQSDPRCRVLLCDESGGEGRNFQVADYIIHYDLPWTPAEIEQRIGRVDRIGKQGEIQSYVVYAADTLEADLFALWQDALKLFEKSMSGMELILERIQDEIHAAISEDLRGGVRELVNKYREIADRLETQIEEEQYWDEQWAKRGMAQYLKRDIKFIREHARLQIITEKWARLHGMEVKKERQLVTFTVPHNNNPFANTPPKWVGTFDRSCANLDESLHFFSLADPFINELTTSILEQTQHSVSAQKLFYPKLQNIWEGFELLLLVQPDPERLAQHQVSAYDAEFISGFFPLSSLRLFLDLEGQLLADNSDIAQAIMKFREKTIPLNASQLNWRTPAWRASIERATQESLRIAEQSYRSQLGEHVKKARYLLAQRLYYHYATIVFGQATDESTVLKQTQQHIEGLIDVLHHPIIWVASISYWRVNA